MVDKIIHLPQSLTLNEPLPRNHIHSGLTTRPGGSGFHFTRASLEAGFDRVEALACVGDDKNASVIRHSISHKRLSLEIVRVPEKTAETVLIYDKFGRRVSIGNAGANNMMLDQLAGKVTGSQANTVFIAGHLFEDPLNRDGFLALLEILKSHFDNVILDVVPHNIQEMIGPKERAILLAHVTGLIGTREALTPFLGEYVSTASEIPTAGYFP